MQNKACYQQAFKVIFIGEWSYRKLILRLRSSRISQSVTECRHIGGSPLNLTQLRFRQLDWIAT